MSFDVKQNIYFLSFVSVYSRTIFPIAIPQAVGVASLCIATVLKTVFRLDLGTISQFKIIQNQNGDKHTLFEWFRLVYRGYTVGNEVFLATRSGDRKTDVSNGITTIYQLEPLKQCMFISILILNDFKLRQCAKIQTKYCF